MILHNRKNTRAYDNKIMTSQTSSLNIAIKSHKQLKQSITAENSKIF